MNKQHIQNYIKNHPELVYVKKQAPGITVLKYKNSVFYKNLWTPELCELRGTVVDDNFDIIQRPFTKIFNYGEKQAPHIDDEEFVTCVEKINGFMGAATIHNGELFVSTTGSISSKYVDLAKKHILQTNWKIMSTDLTYIFEVCDPSDPHIIDEKPGLYLLGTRLKTWDCVNHMFGEERLDDLAEDLGVYRPNYYDLTFGELKENSKIVKHEGFVAWTYDGRELKIKSPYYLVTKFFGRKTQEKLKKLLENQEQIKEVIDEEFYPVIDYISDNLNLYITMTEQQKMKFIREFIESEIFK